MDHPKVSIITIVYNGEKTLEKTIRSIADQTYPFIEYLIVDGQSNDHTLDIIKSYSSKVTRWISEPDTGLYDAMNKGIRMSTGDYLWFINSGDEIPAPDTLEKVFNTCPLSDIYYGDTEMIDLDGNVLGKRRLTPPERLTWKHFKWGMRVSHQSFICSKKIAGMYNLQYRFSADFEWCLLALKNATSICHTKMVLSKFLDGGLTKKNILAGLKERYQIMKCHYGVITTLGCHVVLGAKLLGFFVRYKRF